MGSYGRLQVTSKILVYVYQNITPWKKRPFIDKIIQNKVQVGKSNEFFKSIILTGFPVDFPAITYLITRDLL